MTQSTFDPVFGKDALVIVDFLFNSLIHGSKGAARVKSALKTALKYYVLFSVW